MRPAAPFLAASLAILLLDGCEPSPTLPTAGSFAPTEPASVTDPWGPEYPPFNLEAVLRRPGGGSGFGLVRFRQPNGGGQVAYLDTWVRDLAPNPSYRLQRAVDVVVDGALPGPGKRTGP